MFYRYLLLFGILLKLLTPAFGNFKYNISLTQMDTCSHYVIPSSRGYSYIDFFHLENLKNNKLGKNELLHLKLYVITARDAHVLLSVTSHPRFLDRVYEIVIGAGRNTFSTIRTTMGRRRVATNQESNVLSLLDPTPIEIIQTKDANLIIQIPGSKEEPFLNFTDAAPLNINYISFATYDNIPARWFYDCQFDGFSGELSEDPRPKTPLQLLMQNISEKAENASFPVDLKSVNFSFNIGALRYQQDMSYLQTRLDLAFTWYDDRLKWNPIDFPYIDAVLYEKRDIWLPEIMIVNAASSTKPLLDGSNELKIYSNGTVALTFKDAFLNTWCPNLSNNWPSESLKCDIVLGLDQGPLDELPLVWTDRVWMANVNPLTEWKLNKMYLKPVANGVLARYTQAGVLATMIGDISIVMDISRNSYFYKNVFTIPILTCQILIILSFLLRGYRRGALILVVVLILAMGLMFITKHAPSTYVPDILVAYQHVLRIATFCYILHIILMWLELYPPKAKPSSWLTSTLNFSPLRLILCMRLADSDDYIDVQMHPWREISKMLNAISFLVINAVFIIVDVILLPQM